MQKRSPLTPKVVYGSLALLVAAAALFIIRPKKISVETATVHLGTFIRTLRVDGIIKTKNKITVLARASGDLSDVDLDVGDEVKKNQRIAILKWDYSDAVKSPMSGVISKVYRESAGPINRGDPIVDIIDPVNIEIESEVLTTDALEIPLGSSVKISTGGSNVLQGHVTTVSRAGFKKISALGIEEEKTFVYIAIDSPHKRRLGDVFHVDLEIKISEDPEVLIVPLGALFKNQEHWAVYIVDHNKAKMKNVEISKRNDREALVTKGLESGETVILFPSDQIKDSVPVKAMRSP